MSLEVACVDVFAADGITQYPPHWRVHVWLEYERVVVNPIKNQDFYFASERDANIAKAALEAEGLSTAEALIAAGRQRLREVMCQSLPW